MAIRARNAYDFRTISRIIVRLDCDFTHEGVTHQAVMVNISLKGAFLSAEFLPPNNSAITVTLTSPVADKPIVLEGKVVRGTRVMTDHGMRGRFGVIFSYTPTGIISLITKVKATPPGIAC